MSLSFKDLKRGEIYLLTRERNLWESSVGWESGVGAYRTIPAGTHFLVIDDTTRRAWDPQVVRVYRILVDGILGTLDLGEGDVAPMEEA